MEERIAPQIGIIAPHFEKGGYYARQEDRSGRHPAGDPRLHLGGGPHLPLGAPPGRLPDRGAEPPLALRVPVRPGDGGNAGLLLQPYLIPRLSRHFGKGGRGVCQLRGAPRLPAGHRGLPAVHLWDDAHVFFFPGVRQALSKHHCSRDPLPGARGLFPRRFPGKPAAFTAVRAV